MGLTWTFADLTGGSVADVGHPIEGANTSIALNGERHCEVPLSFDDPASEQVYPQNRAIKAALDGFPIFAGPMLEPDFDVIPGRRVTAQAQCPSVRLQTSYVNTRTDTNFATYAGMFLRHVDEDQSETIARLMEHASPTDEEVSEGIWGHGIIRGWLPPSVERTLPPPQTGQPIWDEMLKLTQWEDGVDIELQPLDRTDGVFAQLTTHYPWQGEDRSGDVIFEGGFGLNNATALRWRPSQARNRWTVQGESVQGQPPLRYTSDQIDSQLTRGIWGQYEAQTGRTDQDPNGFGYNDLRIIARAKCSTNAFPLNNIELTPAQDDGSGFTRDHTTGRIVPVLGTYGAPPRFGPDVGGAHHFWIGDLIRVRAYDRGPVNLEIDQVVRVTDAKLTQTASGAVVTELSLNPRPFEAPVV